MATLLPGDDYLCSRPTISLPGPPLVAGTYLAFTSALPASLKYVGLQASQVAPTELWINVTI